MDYKSISYMIGIIVAMSICMVIKIVIDNYSKATFNSDIKNREIWKDLYKNEFRIKDKNMLHVTVIRKILSEISYRIFLSSVIYSFMILLLISFIIIIDLEHDVTYDLVISIWLSKYYAPLLLYVVFSPLIRVILVLSFIYTKSSEGLTSALNYKDGMRNNILSDFSIYGYSLLYIHTLVENLNEFNELVRYAICNINEGLDKSKTIVNETSWNIDKLVAIYKKVIKIPTISFGATLLVISLFGVPLKEQVLICKHAFELISIICLGIFIIRRHDNKYLVMKIGTLSVIGAVIGNVIYMLI